ncbi:MAG: iron complex transport system ATP-binding protein [Methanolobus sp.]|jgi:iron complex transport system ATP-binding protein|nr:iron complex transport system ATP-binding protein [Methanolobus sp.]
MLKVKNIHFNYGSSKILNDLSFNVEEGQLCGLFGPNGCGKTTLFKCCMNFLKYHTGSVVMGGVDIKDSSIEDMAKIVAYVPQEHKPPFPYLVKEVVLMGRTPHLGGFFGINRDDKEKAWNALKLLDISHLADQPYNQLSGGQRQMVLIARAIAQETRIIFLDEPTSALDFSNQMRIWNLMRKVKDQGITILACSHDPNHVSWFCDKVVVMNRSGILCQGPPHDVITESVLNDVYQDMCSVRSFEGIRMVLPRSVSARVG